MKEFDLRCKDIGSYEYNLLGEEGLGRITLKDISFFDTPLRARVAYDATTITYIKDKNGTISRSSGKSRGANYIFEDCGCESLENFYEANIGPISEHVYCTDSFDLLPFLSVLAFGILSNYGEKNISNPKDVIDTHETRLLKSLLIYFLKGSLYVSSEILVCKITQDGKNFEYAFYFNTDNISIGIKLKPDGTGGALEMINSSCEECRFLI
ncbi:hypothetical protein IKE84_01275 [Candidatus Saccharibacteria bacterium]|nr:hypothetical protein [Candidatus Saccharibacteria bacterium]